MSGADVLFLLFLHRARRLADSRGAVDQCGNASAGTAARHLNTNAGVLVHILLGPSLSEDHHRIRSLDGYNFPFSAAACLRATAPRETGGSRKESYNRQGIGY